MESVEWSGFCEWKKSEWKKRKLIAIFRERYGRWDLGRTVTVRNTKLCIHTHGATTGATALLLPSQNAHTLLDPIRDTEHALARKGLCLCI
jgi:hypothetical protein